MAVVVEGVLLAEFDIDKGSVIRNQYPQPLAIKDNLLADEMLPEGAHLREEDWTVFFLYRQKSSEGTVLSLIDGQYASSEGASKEAEAKNQGFDSGWSNKLCVFNLVQTRSDPKARRGAVVKAIAVVTRHQFYYVFKPVMQLALDQYFKNQSIDVLAALYGAINAMDMSAMPQYSLAEKRAIRAAQSGTPQTFQSHIHWHGTQLPVQIPLLLEPDEVVEASLTSLLRVFKEDTLKIFNAIVCERKVMFMGYKCPAGEVCTLVLSACLLVSPSMFGCTRRAFPYANLNNMEFIEVPGFIAGVTNPIFDKDSFWDVLCNVSTGEVKLSARYQAELDGVADLLEKTALLDTQLLAEVAQGARCQIEGLEYWARCVFRDYTDHLVRIGQQEEHYINPDTEALHVQGNQFRLMQYTQSDQYRRHQAARSYRSARSPLGELEPKIRDSMRMLQVREDVSTRQLLLIFDDLAQHVQTREQILELLSFLPDSQGGLFPLAACLFHFEPKIREKSAQFLRRIDAIKEGSRMIGRLNHFLTMTYHQYRAGNQGLQENEEAEHSSRGFVSPVVEEHKLARE